MFERLLKQFWYEKNEPGALLRALNKVSVALIRRRRYRWRFQMKPDFSVPVIVVGNISVGGAGKTPLVIALAQWMMQMGLQVGIVSRGYGAKPPNYPYPVTEQTHPVQGGDEPCMMAARLGCPVVIDPDRPAAVEFLINHWPMTDIIISDDGLQHYRMNRSVELVVADARRGFGNGLCLPWGPLREPTDRLKDVMALIVNGGSPEGTQSIGELFSVPALSMMLINSGFRRVIDDQLVPLEPLISQQILAPLSKDKTQSKDNPEDLHIAAVAGIGHPERFFSSLGQLGIRARGFAFKDHHQFTPKDFAIFDDARWILMTEKDAVKVREFARTNWLYLAVQAQFSPSDWLVLTEKFLELLQPWPTVVDALKKQQERLILRNMMSRQS